MLSVPTLPGITSQMIHTKRINTHVLTSGPENAPRIVFIHGNFSGSTYWEEAMLALKEYRCIAPDLRGYGDTEDKLIDATRGAKDWSDDLKALSDALGSKPAHLVGWSIGAAAVWQFALDYPELVSSITLVAPISPYGFGGTQGVDGKPNYADCAGSGGGVVNPEFVQRIQAHDTGAESPNSPRNVMNAFFYKPPFKAAREDAFLESSLLEKTGTEKYPGDLTMSGNWPNVAPGKFGPINATSPKYFDVSAIANAKVKPPILWIRGDADQIVADFSLFDMGTLGQLGAVPGWPGADVFPPQPMVSQTRAVLEAYKANGGAYAEVVFENCGHSPNIEKFDAFVTELRKFVK
ncbi:MAG TPA: alpha/beta hydrolase [Thermoflexales bacterium]|nr:alpha/beta hydrolase [Thermoflexales bacterium]HRA01514.1 alpha/beta hydrolase [Thermoflexales bacterium]